MTTIENVTREQIMALHKEADWAGDAAMVADARTVLLDNIPRLRDAFEKSLQPARDALERCVRVIAAAEAMVDPPPLTLATLSTALRTRAASVRVSLDGETWRVELAGQIQHSLARIMALKAMELDGKGGSIPLAASR